MAEWSKAIDLKSIILWMRRFKSCHCRFLKKKERGKRKGIEAKHRWMGEGSIIEDNVAEWLRRLPAKQFPFGSVGSNPAVVVF